HGAGKLFATYNPTFTCINQLSWCVVICHQFMSPFLLVLMFIIDHTFNSVKAVGFSFRIYQLCGILLIYNAHAAIVAGLLAIFYWFCFGLAAYNAKAGY